ncbi:crotonase/enoyl-CoA hydratase family protein [Halomonas mongoliensis]|uniref:crotonase/enoyl-CoA hydratase family protein n=1 Tax=Halomonas mongoliensis TaxID=321265 RepID=UPI00403B16DD
MSDEVLFSTQNGIAFITINRPHAKNAVNRAVAEQVAAAIDTLENDTALRVGVLTGAGGTFCAGMDLKAFAKSGERPRIEGRGFAGLTEAPPRKPLIAAVEGYALAGGFELALACDLIVAGEGAKFGLPEVKRGLCAAAGGLLRLPRQLPYRIALELALTGEMFPAESACKYGLINRLVPAGEAMEAATSLARTLVANAPLALAASKAIVSHSHDWPDDLMFDRQRELTDPVNASEDAREGATAFAEKREPVWRSA